MGEDIFEQIRIFLPKELSPSKTKELFESLSSYPDIPSHYLPPGAVEDDLLQGDGWRGFTLINYNTSERKSVSGVIISNSCDVNIRNRRAISPQVLFSPLIPLAKCISLLKDGGFDNQQVDDFLASIRSQKVTYIYYMPSGPYGPEESIILLDNIHSQPLEAFPMSARSRVFRLNQVSWYILLIKLSIHFTRTNEGVDRFPLR